MSNSGIKLLINTELGFSEAGVPAYITTYRCSSPVVTPTGQHFGASVTTLASGVSEDEFSAQIAQVVVDLANAETSGVEAFVLGDVIDQMDGVSSNDLSLLSLKRAIKSAIASRYTEFTWSSGTLTGLDVWDTPAKLVKLYARTFGYTGDLLTTVTTTDEVTGAVLTQVFTYDGNGDIQNTTETVT